jgi:hypothetical protein
MFDVQRANAREHKELVDTPYPMKLVRFSREWRGHGGGSDPRIGWQWLRAMWPGFTRGRVSPGPAHSRSLAAGYSAHSRVSGYMAGDGPVRSDLERSITAGSSRSVAERLLMAGLRARHFLVIFRRGRLVHASKEMGVLKTLVTIPIGGVDPISLNSPMNAGRPLNHYE